jgi:hypothetical protein
MIEEELKDPIIEYRFDEENHIHNYIDKPLMGTSTVVGIIAKPLTWWAAGLAVARFGWINKGNAKIGWIPFAKRLFAAAERRAQIEELSNEEYLSLLDEAYGAHASKLKTSAKQGTDLHAELEKFVKDYRDGQAILPEFYDSKIHNFIIWFQDNVAEVLWTEMHCYSNRLWVGGISDLGVKLKDGSTGIIDFKSSKESYMSQFIQCAGYDIQITENGGFTKEGYPIFTLVDPIDFYAIVPFGAEEFTIDFRYNVDEIKQGFEAATILYKLNNK